MKRDRSSRHRISSIWRSAPPPPIEPITKSTRNRQSSDILDADAIVTENRVASPHTELFQLEIRRREGVGNPVQVEATRPQSLARSNESIQLDRAIRFFHPHNEYGSLPIR